MTDPTPSLGHALAAALALATMAGAITACSSDPTVATGPSTTTSVASSAPVIDPGDGGDYHPSLRLEAAVATIDNEFLPLLPGSRWVYEGESDGATERIVVEVLDERRTIMGVEAVVVRDQAFVDGELAEDTLDFFTQDTDGNVWYLGEETAEYEGGQVISTEGSWLAGVDGALPGIVMPAHPAVGDAYRQEYLAGEAEDMGEVIAVDGDVVTTRDWTPLEPEVIEEKDYRRGTGLVAERQVAGGAGEVQLVEFRPGSGPT